MRNDNNAEHDFHAIMNQRTPDFRQLQPNFTIQVGSCDANNNNNNNNNKMQNNNSVNRDNQFNESRETVDFGVI